MTRKKTRENWRIYFRCYITTPNPRVNSHGFCIILDYNTKNMVSSYYKGIYMSDQSTVQPTPSNPTVSAANTTEPVATALEKGQSVGASGPVNPVENSEEIDISLFARLNLRIATIEAVEAVPKSKKLYRIQLDLGTMGKRQIVSGIAQHYTPEELIGQQIVVIANLKPAKLMGVESHGMLLAASCDDGAAEGAPLDTGVVLLTPRRPITAGARVR
jgi:methionine--tRNA ligase beta chain